VDWMEIESVADDVVSDCRPPVRTSAGGCPPRTATLRQRVTPSRKHDVGTYAELGDGWPNAGLTHIMSAKRRL
jgi:hypothetical protein